MNRKLPLLLSLLFLAFPAYADSVKVSKIAGIDPLTATITGGVIDGAIIGGTTPAAATFTTLNSGAHTVTSISVNSLIVGANGATNPVLQIDDSTASVATGVKITGAAAGGNILMSATSSGTNESFNIASKGTGNINLQIGSSTRLFVNPSQVGFQPTTSGTAANVRFTFTGAADTALTASTEAPSIYFNMAQIRQHTAGALTLQRDMRVSGSTHSATSATTITNSATLAVDTYAQAGTNATITTASGIYVPTQAAAGTVTNAYALNIAAPTGAATINAAALISGHVQYTGTSTAVTSGAADCGTSPAIVGNDNAGRITVGSSTNGAKCTITFATTWNNAPICTVSDETTGVLVRPVITTSTLAVTGVIVAGDKLDYICHGYQ